MSDYTQFIQENIYANFEAGNVEGVMAVLDENIRWTHHGSRDLIPFAGEWNGHAGVGEFFGSFIGGTEPVFVNVKGIVAQGDTVVVLINESYTVKATGKTYVTDVAHIWKVANDKIIAFDELYDSAAIAEAYKE
ncbi:nuclear transport factor 2 family protein [Porticoccaceae bacterium]|nr:nuclear transport factor 2 family protein [Porticoccaceae bacterium]MDB3967366.1 nuclear transport factor 2 family protein [Porticoccaceae bacterium]|tara:strand:+ start:9332 stop:9733 length:402 start_codon:yes stop_codon:yes gene_type:complete